MGNAKGYILAIALPSHIHTSLYLCHEESEDFSKPKIIWGEISDKSKFAFDFLGEYIPEATSFSMLMTDSFCKLESISARVCPLCKSLAKD